MLEFLLVLLFLFLFIYLLLFAFFLLHCGSQDSFHLSPLLFLQKREIEAKDRLA